MPRRKLPDYQIDKEEYYYRYRDTSRPDAWWWACTCSKSCWDSQVFSRKSALLAHQRSRGSIICPIDDSFVPPVHIDTVEVQAPPPRAGTAGTSSAACREQRSAGHRPAGASLAQKRSLVELLAWGDGGLQAQRDQDTVCSGQEDINYHDHSAPGVSDAEDEHQNSANSDSILETSDSGAHDQGYQVPVLSGQGFQGDHGVYSHCGPP